MTTLPLLQELLASRLDPSAREWCAATAAEIAGGVDDGRFAALLSLASRHAKRDPLAPDTAAIEAAGTALEGWTPERWSVLETLRVVLVLSRTDLAEESGAAAIEEAFRYADEGELCALYRSLAHLPAPERFAWRAGEGCRTNMVSVFEAVTLDTPYPARFFDDVAWRQAVIKCVFVGAPLWRMWGLDGRLTPDLARMALDLADERRSAHREVQPELWLCLGTHGGERGLASLEQELDGGHVAGRRAAALALARAGEADRLEARVEAEADAEVAQTMRAALAGATDQGAFAALDPQMQESRA